MAVIFYDFGTKITSWSIEMLGWRAEICTFNIQVSADVLVLH